jgi:copper chaperone CopZ
MTIMKHFALLASAALLIGCADTAFETVSNANTDPATEPSSPEVDSAPVLTSYEAGESVVLAIPEMSCAVMCFPKAKDALEEIDGIAAIELVEQEEEGVINDRRVLVTFDGKVDSKTAITALDAVEMSGASFAVNEAGNN